MGLDDMNFHDAEILEIKCDYKKEIVSIRLAISDEEREVVLQIQNFRRSEIENKNPWGDGMYVVHVEQKRLDDGIQLNILVNSGDHIIVEGESLEVVK